MTEICSAINHHLIGLRECIETINGARIRTTCIYPSFEPVFVYVAKLGDGFLVHDAGETMAVVLSHGYDGTAAKRAINIECRRYALTCETRRISVKIDAAEWIESAIVSVANACSSAARNAVKESAAKSENDLADSIFSILQSRLPAYSITKGYHHRGVSGRSYKFDLAVQNRQRLTLIEVVGKHANSVNAKYVALSDVSELSDIQKIAAHDGSLSAADILLLQNVATVAGPNGVSDLVMENDRIH